MRIQPHDDVLQVHRLQVLRATLRKIETDPEPLTPTLSHLHSMLLTRIADLEAAETLIRPGRFHANQISQ